MSEMVRTGYVYILASKSRRLYIGVTTNPTRRWLQHRTGAGSQHARKYHLAHLVHLEACGSPASAIAREKQLKGWRRSRKLALVSATNPGWKDLAVEWGWHRLVEQYEEAISRGGSNVAPSSCRPERGQGPPG
jgi:putative endonuclease